METYLPKILQAIKPFSLKSKMVIQTITKNKLELIVFVMQNSPELSQMLELKKKQVTHLVNYATGKDWQEFIFLKPS